MALRMIEVGQRAVLFADGTTLDVLMDVPAVSALRRSRAIFHRSRICSGYTALLRPGHTFEYWYAVKISR